MTSALLPTPAFGNTSGNRHGDRIPLQCEWMHGDAEDGSVVAPGLENQFALGAVFKALPDERMEMGHRVPVDMVKKGMAH